MVRAFSLNYDAVSRGIRLWVTGPEVLPSYASALQASS